jgi:predicted porin
MESFTALGTEDVSSVIGAAVNYESKERGTPDPNDNYFSWTVDGSFESNGLSLYAAVVGRHSDNDGASDVDQYGFQTQVSYLFTEKLEPYLRYEYIDYDDNTAFDGSGAAADDLGLLTAGLNYYISGHSAKVTFDVMYAFDSVSISRPLVGLLADEDGEDGQVSIRAQFQLLF